MRRETIRNVFGSLAVGALGALPFGACGAGLEEGWSVLARTDGSTLTTPNLLANAACDVPGGATTPIAGWGQVSNGYQAAVGEGRNGSNAIKIVKTNNNDYGAGQAITLNQTTRRGIYFGAYSKASDVTENPDSGYSLWLDIEFMDGTRLYARTVTFSTGTHDWEWKDRFLDVDRPIRSVAYYAFLRGSHQGTVWFDDLVLKEAELITFDGQLGFLQPQPAGNAGAVLQLDTADGLSLGLTQIGGQVSQVRLGAEEMGEPTATYRGGFLVRDVATASDWVHVGGTVDLQGGTATHAATLPGLGLQFDATYAAQGDRIQVRADLTNLSGQDRAVTLYFALPIGAGDWVWGDDIRRSRTAAGEAEYTNQISQWHPVWRYQTLGATGYFSRYPFASIAKAGAGLAIGFPIDEPRIARGIFHPITRQYFAAFDLGITPRTRNFPNRSWVEFSIYRTQAARPEDAFRSALAGYAERYPQSFDRRIPPAAEGISVSFTDLSQMTHGPGQSIEDFQIGAHQMGSGWSQLDFDKAHGILAFHRLGEPNGEWMHIDPSAPLTDPVAVMAYVQDQYQAGVPDAEVVLHSGIQAPVGTYSYAQFPEGVPWRPPPVAYFQVNPNPDVSEAPYVLNKAHELWNADAQQNYTDHPRIDGEFLDSFQSYAVFPNLRSSHIEVARTPPTFHYEAPHAVCIPLCFSSIEFIQWMKPSLPAGKFLWANSMLDELPWGAGLFDCASIEVAWFAPEAGGVWRWAPESDALLSYRRSLQYRKPYHILLLGADFAALTPAQMETYFKTCLFYAFYPSMHEKVDRGGRYFDDPALYNRDRPLFQTYVPIIKLLSAAGWQPVTSAFSSGPDVYLERYGSGDALYFTVRNAGAAGAAFSLTFDRAGLGIPPDFLLDGESLTPGFGGFSLPAGESSVNLAFGAGEVQAFRLVARAAPGPDPGGPPPGGPGPSGESGGTRGGGGGGGGSCFISSGSGGGRFLFAAILLLAGASHGRRGPNL